MTTATFENATSRAVEDAALSMIRRAWHLSKWKRLPDKTAADFGIEFPDGKQAIIEVKGRTRKYLTALTVEIAAKKVRDMEDLARHFGNVEAFLVFVFLIDRSVWWVKLEMVRASATAYTGGRAPRPNSANDQEAMLSIPIKVLTPFSEWIDGGAADAAIEYNIEHRNG